MVPSAAPYTLSSSWCPEIFPKYCCFPESLVDKATWSNGQSHLCWPVLCPEGLLSTSSTAQRLSGLTGQKCRDKAKIAGVQGSMVLDRVGKEELTEKRGRSYGKDPDWMGLGDWGRAQSGAVPGQWWRETCWVVGGSSAGCHLAVRHTPLCSAEPFGSWVERKIKHHKFKTWTKSSQ